MLKYLWLYVKKNEEILAKIENFREIFIKNFPRFIKFHCYMQMLDAVWNFQTWKTDDVQLKLFYSMKKLANLNMAISEGDKLATYSSGSRFCSPVYKYCCNCLIELKPGLRAKILLNFSENVWFCSELIDEHIFSTTSKYAFKSRPFVSKIVIASAMQAKLALIKAKLRWTLADANDFFARSMLSTSISFKQAITDLTSS